MHDATKFRPGEPAPEGRVRGDTDLVRSLHAAFILKALHQEGVCSRARLTRVTHLSSSTVSRIVRQLMRQGIVTEERRGESTGGRRPVLLRLDHTKLHVVGVQLRRDRAAVMLSDLRGEALHRRTYRPFDLDPTRCLREVAREVKALLDSERAQCRHVLGVGLAISGVVDSTHRTVARSVNLGWRDVPAASLLEDLVGLPVFVENDANAAALAEMWFGASHDRSFMFLKTDAGTGAGLVLEGHLMSGPRGMAGEIGHLPLFADGYRCRCGATGCLEPYVHLDAVLTRYTERAGGTVDGHTFFERARSGDPVASQLVREAGEALTSIVVFAAMTLDLDAVVIGGAWGEFDDGFLEQIAAECRRVAENTGLDRDVEVRGSVLGEDSDLLGAVGLVMDRTFNPSALAATLGDRTKPVRAREGGGRSGIRTEQMVASGRVVDGVGRPGHGIGTSAGGAERADPPVRPQLQGRDEPGRAEGDRRDLESV